MFTSRILILFLFSFGVLNSSFSQSQTLFTDKDFDAVAQQAKAEKKPIVIMFYATWCPHCNKMKKEVLPQQEIVDFYNQNYICIASNIESKEGIALRERFKSQFVVKSFPTFAFLDFNLNVTNCISGEFSVDSFIKEARSNLNPENQLQSIRSKFEYNNSDYNLAFAYILATKRIGQDPTPIAQKFLGTVSPNDYYTESNWRLLSNGITDFSAPEFINVIKNRAQFEKAVSASRIDKKIAYVINETFTGFSNTLDSLNYKKYRAIAENLHDTKVDSLLFFQDLQFYENTTNWKAYNKTLEKSMNQYGITDANFINKVCTNYYDFIDDKKMLANAVNWQKENIKIMPALNKFVLISNLLAKMKAYKDALQYANQGKQLAESAGFNTTEIDKIIAELQTKLK